jgi:hypothetical protein
MWNLYYFYLIKKGNPHPVFEHPFLQSFLYYSPLYCCYVLVVVYVVGIRGRRRWEGVGAVGI